MNKRIIHTVFENIALTYPSNVAIEEGNRQIGYAELNQKSNCLAHFLRESGVGIDSIVGVMMPSGIPLVNSLLAIFKAGGIYMPIDLELSEKRFSQIFNNCPPEVLITTQGHQENVISILRTLQLEVNTLIVLDNEQALEVVNQPTEASTSTSVDLQTYATDTLEVINTPKDGNYIFYTSGSTGEPKAILGCHDSLSHFIHWEKKEFATDQQTRVSQLTAISFDASLRDIFLPLCSGGTLCIPSAETKNNIVKLIEWLNESAVTLVHTVPSLVRLIIKMLPEFSEENLFPQLKHLMMSGEMLYASDIENWRNAVGKHVELVNLYGATETTMIKTCHRIDTLPSNRSERIHVGQPISNTAIAIINDKLCGLGEIGKVYIKTPFITKGYFNDPELTEKVFVQNPLVQDKEDIIYNTGDLGRYLDNGNIEILGREDDQVKLNGIRVEIGEIKQAVRSIDRVEDVEIIPHTNEDKQKALICYFVGAPSVEELKNALHVQLNKELIPSWFFKLNEIPLNRNGKVDKNALPKPSEMLISEQSYKPVEGPVEEKLEELWKNILGLDKIGSNISFFKIGGNSLKAIQLISRVYKEFGIMILVRDIFSSSTIGELAETISRLKTKSDFQEIPVLANLPYYDLSHAQKRLWIMEQYGDNNSAYNINSTFLLNGNLDRDVFKQVMFDLVRRHEALRTTFTTVEKEPKQKVNDFDVFDWNFHTEDLKGCHQDQIQEKLRKEAEKKFNLEQGPLVRFALYESQQNTFIFSFTVHHIICDEWSLQLLINEAFALYDAYCNNEASPLPVLKIQYKEFASWQNQLLEDEHNIGEHKQFWKGNLAGDLPVLNITTDFPRPAYKTYHGGLVKGLLNRELINKLERLAKQEDASVFMLLLTAVNTLFHRYTGQNDIIIGAPVAGREHPDLENQVGFYINNLALRTQIDGEETFKSLLHKVKANTLNSFDHQIYPFDRLIEDLNIPRNTSRSPLFDVALVLLNLDIEKEDNKISGLDIQSYDSGLQTSALDIRMVFEETREGYFMVFEYNSDLFQYDTIANMMRHFELLLDAALTSPSAQIDKINYLESNERDYLLHKVNNTEQVFEDPECIHLIFEQQVKETPNAVAISLNGENWTYQQVNDKANSLADHFRNDLGVEPNQVVGLMASAESRNTIIAILAILKAGGAYLPIDVDLPVKRKERILQHAGVQLLITEAEMLADLLNIYAGEIFALDAQWDSIKDYHENLPSVNQPEDTAYVIYTSGSTGEPKGVAISHQSQVNMSLSQVEKFNVSQDDKVLQLASLSFDASVSEIFMAFYTGATLVLKQKSLLFDQQGMVEYLKSHKVSVVTFPPSLLSTLNLDQLGFLRAIITAGEPAKVADLTYLSQFMECYNAYGPTECAVCVSIYSVKPEDKNKTIIPIGSPIANTKVYILDDNLQLVPKGVEGTIYVSGKGLAKGYLHQEELTAANFIDNPYELGTKLYSTGDRGKWTAEGQLIFLGRADNQVKINGHRIELGEIETLIIQHPSVKNAVVVKQNDHNNEAFLTAYYITSDELSSLTLRGYLSEHIPNYAIPSYFVEVDKFELNNSGKINISTLPDPNKNNQETTEYIAPQSDIETAVAAIWEVVLGREKVGTEDNFFDLGGNSLKAIQILAGISDQFNVKLDLGKFFTVPNVRAIAALIQTDDQEEGSLIPVVEQEYYDVTNAQRRLWVLQQMNADLAAYNIPVAFKIKGNLNVKSLSEAFQQLIDRHQSLRTSFQVIDGVLKQKIEKEPTLVLEHIDISNRQADANDLIAGIFNHRFDLTRDTLMKVCVLEVTEQQYLLAFNMHHIIGDEWSMAILVKELLHLYQAINENISPELPGLEIQYKDFASWQNERLNSGALEDHKNYWLNKLKDPAPKVDFPITQGRPNYKTYTGKVSSVQLDKEISQEVLGLSQKSGSSLFMVLTASVYALLNKYTGLNDLVIGTPATQRLHQQLQNQMGLYLNLLVLRTSFDEEDSFEQLLDQTKQNIIEAFQYQEYPFDQLVEDLKLPRDVDRSPLFDIMVVLHDKESEDIAMPDLEGLTIEQLTDDDTTSRYDMSFHFRQTEEGLSVSLEYNTDLFPDVWIEQLLINYRFFVQQLLNNPTIPLGKVSYLSAENKQRLLTGFNQVNDSITSSETIVSLFEKQVQSNPDATAYQFENITLTYDALNKLSNQIAHYLKKEYSVEQGDLICLLMDRSEKMMVALLGVLKTGAAYVPISIDYPEARINYVLEDTNAKCLILDNGLGLNLELGNTSPITPANWETISTYPDQNLTSAPISSDLAYVIYTSGSTGVPKGVMIEHQGVVNRLDWMWKHYGFNSNDVILQKTTYVFDVSVWELFMPIMYGARIVMCSQEVVFNTRQLTECITNYGITTLHFVPGMLQLFLQGVEDRFLPGLSSLKRVICSGEALPSSLVKLSHEKLSVELHNLYGPTEASIDVSYYQTHVDDEIIPIGRPIANTQLYILDDNKKLQPEGVLGEIGIGGHGLARGYLNKEDLTTAKFVSIDLGRGMEERIYLSGDLGYWSLDGNIVYHGRKDTQVKIHGQRIELGEIENVMAEFVGIDMAIVTTSNLDDSQKICAYYTSDTALDASQIKSYLADRLPAYMLPTYFISLDEVPLNANGKIDRKALPPPSINHLVSSKHYSAPQTELQHRLVEHWQVFIGDRSIGMEDNFFDLGGNSLKIIMLHERLKQEFPDLQVMDLFKYPSIRELSQFLEDDSVLEMTGLEV